MDKRGEGYRSVVREARTAQAHENESKNPREEDASPTGTLNHRQPN